MPHRWWHSVIQLVVAGMHRDQYLHQTRDRLSDYHPQLFATRIESHDTVGLGMARGIQAAWDLALRQEWDYLLHWEEDMLPTRPAPLDDAVAVLEAHPHVAQMLFQRAPWWGSDPEMQTGSVLGGMLTVAPDKVVQRDGWAEQTHIFSLNPCLIPRRVVELGWPEGPLGIGNESGMTIRLLALGMSFGVWTPADGLTYAEHIGHERGTGWKL